MNILATQSVGVCVYLLRVRSHTPDPDLASIQGVVLATGGMNCTGFNGGCIRTARWFSKTEGSNVLSYQKHTRQSYYLTNTDNIKGIVYQRMKILASSTYPQIVPNLYEFISSAEHKRRYFKKCG